jgi:hypothetical protein
MLVLPIKQAEPAHPSSTSNKKKVNEIENIVFMGTDT